MNGLVWHLQKVIDFIWQYKPATKKLDFYNQTA